MPIVKNEAPTFSYNLGPHEKAESRANNLAQLQGVLMNVAAGRYRLGTVRNGELIQQVRIGLGVNISTQGLDMEEIPYNLTTLNLPLQRGGERLSLMADLGIAEAALRMYFSEEDTARYGRRQLSFYDPELLLKTFALIDLCLQNSLVVDMQGEQPVRLNLPKRRLTTELREEIERTIAELRPDFRTSQISHVTWLTTHFPASNVAIGSITGDEDLDRQIAPLIAEQSAQIATRRTLHRTLANIRSEAARREPFALATQTDISLDAVNDSGLSLQGIIQSTLSQTPPNEEKARAFLEESGLTPLQITIVLDYFLDGLKFYEIDSRYKLTKGQAAAIVTGLRKDSGFMRQLHSFLLQETAS
ncbi:MAG TPA: hypothetical protein VF820_06760 [Patescibacteria group bacterium]